MKALIALAKYLTSFYHLGRGCVANLTHMLQTSGSNPTHVLVASNTISLFAWRGEYIYYFIKSLASLIILLNPLPVLVALKILREIISFTRSFMINTRPLVGCLETQTEKLK